ncbi:hypothetical protein KIN20_007162 [Parelaphostrongylus tenuis]|uniref:Uncharacterized protein n=1 Tax=Parelaphostrongylus tenuis TaxID=148309 RepID=A0AAD5QLR6_PARTN|nr:hypothetical protein KIN20_007162 [Parelaphostrongylus tenuis]
MEYQDGLDVSYLVNRQASDCSGTSSLTSSESDECSSAHDALEREAYIFNSISSTCQLVIIDRWTCSKKVKIIVFCHRNPSVTHIYSV